MGNTVGIVSPEQLLHAVEQIDTEQLESLVPQLLSRAAQRLAPSLSTEETRLLEAINRGLSQAQESTYRELAGKVREGVADDAEYAEFAELQGQLETLHTNRLRNLLELANRRRRSLPDLMNELGLEPPAIEG